MFAFGGFFLSENNFALSVYYISCHINNDFLKVKHTINPFGMISHFQGEPGPKTPEPDIQRAQDPRCRTWDQEPST